MHPNQQQQQHQRHGSVDGTVLPYAPPPTPALICGDEAFSALSTPGQPTLPESILAVAKGLMDFEPRHPDSIHNSNNIINVAADLASCTSEASLLAILDGFCGGNFQFPAQASHSTLETMWPWLSETELGSAIGDDARGKDVGERTRAMIQAVKKWVDRMLSFPFKKKTAANVVVEEIPKTPEEIYQGLYAMQKAALEADAAEAAARRAAQQAQLRQHFADAIRGQAEARKRGDAQVAHYEGFWAAVVAKLDDVIAATVELDDTNITVNVDDSTSTNVDANANNDGKGKASATPRHASLTVTVTDTDAHNAQLRLKGRSARAVGYPRREWAPSLEMRDPAHLSVPVHAAAGDGRPPHCPCGTNCFCIDRVLPSVRLQRHEAVQVHPRATRCGGLVVVPRFGVRVAADDAHHQQQAGSHQVYHHEQQESVDHPRRATHAWELESDSDSDTTYSDTDSTWSEDECYRLSPASDEEWSVEESVQRTLRLIELAQRRSRGRQ